MSVHGFEESLGLSLGRGLYAIPSGGKTARSTAKW